MRKRPYERSGTVKSLLDLVGTKAGGIRPWREGEHELSPVDIITGFPPNAMASSLIFTDHVYI